MGWGEAQQGGDIIMADIFCLPFDGYISMSKTEFVNWAQSVKSPEIVLSCFPLL